MRLVTAAVALLLTLWWPATAGTITANGVSLHYEEKGSGDPVLLLHGFGECGSSWGRIADELAKKHRVIALDMRGHGRSTSAPGDFTHRQSAEDVRALIQSLKLKPAKAIGFSSGGMTLLHVAAKYPELLDKLVVVGAAHQFPDQTRAFLRAASFERLPPPARAEFIRCAAGGEKQVREMVHQFRAFADMQDDMNLTGEDLAKVTAPTLIVHGDRDAALPISIPVAMHRGIPQSALWIVPWGHHGRTAGADMGEFVQTVETFFAK